LMKVSETGRSSFRYTSTVLLLMGIDCDASTTGLTAVRASRHQPTHH
jgi:hypothetical protein